MASALLLVLDYREAETVFTEPLLLDTVVGGDWGPPGLAASPKPQRLGCLGKPQSRSPAAGGLYADSEQLAGFLVRPRLLLARAPHPAFPLVLSDVRARHSAPEHPLYQ